MLLYLCGRGAIVNEWPELCLRSFLYHWQSDGSRCGVGVGVGGGRRSQAKVSVEFLLKERRTEGGYVSVFKP